MLLDPSDTNSNKAGFITQDKSDQQKKYNDNVSKEKDEKLNTYFSSNSISPQSTVTQLTDTAINGKYP